MKLEEVKKSNKITITPGKPYKKFSSEMQKQILKLTESGIGGAREAIKSGEADNDIFFVVSSGDNVIGWSTFFKYPLERKNANIMVFISPKLRKAGLGKKLFMKAFNGALKAGYIKISVWPTHKRGSKKFFLRMKELVGNKVKSFNING